MPEYKIQLPNNTVHYIELDGLSFGQEEDAVVTLVKVFGQGEIDFTIKQTRDRKVFINTQQGELASVVCSCLAQIV